MTLTKTQLLNNLIKYNAISVNEAKRFNLSKRESIVRFMNEHLPANVIKEIYEYEYCTDDDKKDYTPIKNFNPYITNQPVKKIEMTYSQEHKGFISKNKENNQESLKRKHKKCGNNVTVGDLLAQGKLKFAKKEKPEMIKMTVSDEAIKKVLDKIEEIY